MEARGKIDVPSSSGGIKLDNVLYVPGITKNLLSVGSIEDGKAKLKVMFDSDNFSKIGSSEMFPHQLFETL